MPFRILICFIVKIEIYCQILVIEYSGWDLELMDWYCLKMVVYFTIGMPRIEETGLVLNNAQK